MNIIDEEEDRARLRLEDIEDTMERGQLPPLTRKHRISSYPNIKRSNPQNYQLNRRRSLPLPKAEDSAGSDNESSSFLTKSDDEDEAIENGHDDFIFYRTT